MINNKDVHIGRTRYSKHLGKKASVKSLKRYCNELWRKLAVIRDGDKCFYCGETKYLNVHHLISRKHLRTRYELNNALTLCSGCHLFRITSIHHSPWIILEELEKQRKEQYNWFVLNRSKDKLLDNNPINYEIVLKTLKKDYYSKIKLERSMSYKFSEDEEKIMVQENIDGLRLTDIAKKHNCDSDTIHSIFKRIKHKCVFNRIITQDRKEEIKTIHQKSHGHPVYKLDINNNIIEEYLSIRDAAIKNNMSSNCVQNCIDGRSKTAGGFKWILKKDYLDSKLL